MADNNFENNSASNILLTCKELYEKTLNSNICIFNVALKSINNKQTEPQLFIPNSYEFDIEVFSDNSNKNLPHMMVNKNTFEKLISNYKITKNTYIVFYENNGVYASPRALFMFKSMGYHNVHILNDNFKEWQKLHYPVSASKINTIQNLNRNNADFSDFKQTVFCDISIVKKASIDTRKYQIIDARAQDRFLGAVSEPRANLRSGHIPNSINLPFAKLLENNKYINLYKIKQEFENLKVNYDKKIIFTCGSGITACILAVGAYILGFENIYIYDGSWSEWGQSHLNNIIDI